MKPVKVPKDRCFLREAENRGKPGLEMVQDPCYDSGVESERKNRFFVGSRLQEVGRAVKKLSAIGKECT